MKKNRWKLSMAALAALTAFSLSGCGQKNSEMTKAAALQEETIEQTAPEYKRVKIVTTIFPEYDWVKQIAGDEASNMDLKLLLDNGVDLHSYQPTAEDIMKISDCDLFVYVGGESDAWVDGALKEAVNKDMKVIDLLDVLNDTVKIEEVVPGMQNEEDTLENEEEEYDEHVWLSLKNAKRLCGVIAEALEEIDPEHADVYDANMTAYEKQLDELDAQYQETVDNAKQKTLLFGDRFPFRYLVDDYGLSYYAAFAGCSAESEASFETITFLANKVDELGLKNIMTIEKSDQKVAKTIVENTDAKNRKILTLDSMQSTTSDDIANGETYLSAMEKNLEVLKEALQ